MDPGRRRQRRFQPKPNLLFRLFTMLIEICMQIFPCYLYYADKLTIKNYAKTISLLCAGNKVFSKHQVQGGAVPPLRTPLYTHENR